MRFRLALVIVLSLLALPLAAQTEVGAWYVKPTVDTTNNDGARTKFKDITGYAVSLNHFWKRHFSTELAYSVAEGDGSVSVAGAPVLNIGDLKLKAVTLTAQWHLRLPRFDPYGGVGFAAVGASDLHSNDLIAADIQSIAIQNSHAWLANAGVGFDITPRFGVAADAKYYHYRPQATPKGGTATRLELNPLQVGVGVRWRF